MKSQDKAKRYDELSSKGILNLNKKETAEINKINREMIREEQRETNTGQDIERESKEQKQMLDKYNGEEIKTRPTF